MITSLTIEMADQRSICESTNGVNPANFVNEYESNTNLQLGNWN